MSTFDDTHIFSDFFFTFLSPEQFAVQRHGKHRTEQKQIVEREKTHSFNKK